MLKSVFQFLLIASSLTGFGQSIASLNFRHLYDPQNEVDLSMRLVNEKKRLMVYYRLQQIGSDATNNYSIAWQKMESITQTVGTPLSAMDSVATSGTLSFPVPEKPWFLVAKVTNKSSATTWSYFQVIDAKYPVNGFL